MNDDRSSRWWAVLLIVAGVGLLGFVFVSAVRIVSDPGGYFDRWVPAEEAQGPEASFSWTSTNRRVELRDTSTAGEADLTGRVWDFGDGTTSEEPNPTHRYDQEGEYTVQLEVTDADGLTSRAEAAVGAQAGTENSGQGELGLTELADSVTATVERVAKGIGVVLLVIGLFVVMVMAGGRLLKHGVRALRPIPERISVKVRPRELEHELRVDFAEPTDAATSSAPTPEDERQARVDAQQDQDERATLGV